MKNSAFFLSLVLLIINIAVWQSYPGFTIWQSNLAIVIIIAIFAAFIFWARKRPLANSAFITILLLAGILLRTAYLTDTPFNVRSYDVANGHLKYINYIIQNHSLPKAGDCWQCYQPPLYYSVVSPICTVFSCQKTSAILLQIASLILDFGFLYFGIKLLRLLLPTKTGDLYFKLAAALLIFWPSGIINSVRIGNDSLLYFLMAAGLYFITLWYIDEKASNLWLSVGFLILGLLTKTNGIILFGIIGFVLFIKFLNAENAKKKKLFIVGLKIFLLIGFFLSVLLLHPGQFQKTVNNKNLLVGNINGLDKTLIVGNSLANYITFDVRDYLKNTFIISRDAPGRQIFSNVLLKTSLFGEFKFSQNFLKKIAQIEDFFLLALLPSVGIAMFFSSRELYCYFRKRGREITPTLLIAPFIIIFLAAIIVFRYIYPFSCSNDFRYIYPVTIYISGAAAYGIFKLNRTHSRQTKKTSATLMKWAAFAGESIIYLFLATSIIFFIGLVVM